MHNATRQSRLEARIAPLVHAILQRAAEIDGRSLTDFVVAAAKHSIEQADVIRLRRESAALFASLLIEHPPVASAKDRVRSHHKRLVGPL
ncbi:MAG: DUF1778 domain-containing protein [Paracoccaceae bacterium]